MLPDRIGKPSESRQHNDIRHRGSFYNRSIAVPKIYVLISMPLARVFVTKDADFVDSLLITNQPDRLLLVSTGNIRNVDLLVLVEKNLATIVDAFADARFVELNRASVIVHL